MQGASAHCAGTAARPNGPALLPAAACDYTTGYLAAYGILLAAVGLSPHGLWIFVILMGLAGMASTIQSPLPYAKAIAA